MFRIIYGHREIQDTLANTLKEWGWLTRKVFRKIRPDRGELNNSWRGCRFYVTDWSGGPQLDPVGRQRADRAWLLLLEGNAVNDDEWGGHLLEVWCFFSRLEQAKNFLGWTSTWTLILFFERAWSCILKIIFLCTSWLPIKNRFICKWPLRPF